MKISASILLTLILLSLGQFAFGADKDVNVVVTPYVSTEQSCENISARTALCYFDVPAGKILQIEHVSGFTNSGNVLWVGLRTSSFPGPLHFQWLVPTSGPAFAPDVPVTSVIYSASVQGYASDSNTETDGSGETRDFRINVETDGLEEGLQTACTVVGRLSAEP